MCFTASLLLLAGCEEAKRYEISGGDSTPPGRPVFLDSEPLPGGARVFFRPPVDEDVLIIEAAYRNSVGETVRFAASYLTYMLDVYGLGSEGEHTIEMYAIDRAGNRSASIFEKVIALEPPVVTVAKSMQVLTSFASMLLKWNNLLEEPLYVSVDLNYMLNGTIRDYTIEFASNKSEDARSIEGLNLFNDEPVSVKVSVRDKFKNTVLAKEASIVLLTDEIIGKTGWRLPAPGVMMGGIEQADGLNMEKLKDGEIDFLLPGNYFTCTEETPWNILIELGDKYEISRIVTHQRRSGGSGEQGYLYRGDNVLAYNLYGWDDTYMTWERWSRHNIISPVIKDPTEYTTMGIAGDMAFIFPDVPQFSKPTRWFRLEAVNGQYISEITLYGRKAK